jgi:hypothetical protein
MLLSGPLGSIPSGPLLFWYMNSAYQHHSTSILGVAGWGAAEMIYEITPALSIIVLLLTAANLIIEIRKKTKKD